MGVFTVASLAAGVAPTGELLIVGRAAQGVGAALMSTSCLALLSRTFDPGPERAKAFGWWAAAAGSGGAIGVLGGGIIVDLTDWRWTLLINVPVGVALILLVLTIGSVRPVERPRLDLVGGGAFAITAAAAVIAVASLAETSPVWMAPEIWGPVAVAGFAVFVAVESRQASPLIPFGVLRATGAWRPTATMFFLGGAMTATFFFTTLNLQEFHGLTPLVTGVAFLPLSLGAFGAAASAHLLQRRLGVDMTTTIGASVMSVGLVATWLVAGGSSPGMLIAATGVFGIGMGVALAAISDGTTLLLPSALTGIAAAVLTTAQQLGNSVGLAGTSVLDAAHPSIFYQTGSGSAAVLASLATAVIAGHTLARRRFPGPDKSIPIPSEDVPPLRRTGVPTMIDDHRGKRFT